VLDREAPTAFASRAARVLGDRRTPLVVQLEPYLLRALRAGLARRAGFRRRGPAISRAVGSRRGGLLACVLEMDQCGAETELIGFSFLEGFSVREMSYPQEH
jgi:hypothetical protein